MKRLLVVIFVIAIACGRSDLQPPISDGSTDLEILDTYAAIVLPDTCLDILSTDCKVFKADIGESSCGKEWGG